MDYQYTQPMQKQAEHEAAMAAQAGNSQMLGVSGRVGSNASFGGGGIQAAMAPKAPDGVISLTEQAHQAFEILSRELGELHAHLQPLIEPWPESHEQGTKNQTCEAAAVTLLRSLIEKIADKTTYLRQLNSALRV